MEKQNILLVKNMVCQRCIMTVENILKKLGTSFNKISLGEIHLEERPTENVLARIDHELKAVGFELIDTRVNKIIEGIKKAVRSVGSTTRGDRDPGYTRRKSRDHCRSI